MQCPPYLPCRRCSASLPMTALRCGECGIRSPHTPTWGLALVCAALLVTLLVAYWRI
jgi:hypothetical protein